MTIISPAKRKDAEARLADALGHLKRSGDEVHYDSYFEFNISAGMLLAELNLSNAITAREREEIVAQTLLAMFRANENTIDKLEERIRTYQASKLKLPRKTYHLLASIRAKRPIPLPRGNLVAAKIDGVHVRFAEDYPKKARLKPYKIGDHTVDLRGHPPFVPVWATVKARSELEAADRAMAVIKSMLGCVNFCLNHGAQRFHSGRRLPGNQVRLVGEQLIFRGDWSRFEDFFFYEEESEHPERWPVDLDRALSPNRKALDRMLARLNDKVFGKLLIEGMQDYQEALSHMDTALVHIRLWGLLERLTGSEDGESRTTIRRATFISREAEIRRRRLSQAAKARHAFVHRRVRAPFIDHVAEDLRYWVEEMLIYIFFVRRKFRDLDFFFKVLDAPWTAKDVERATAILRIAREAIRYPPDVRGAPGSAPCSP